MSRSDTWTSDEIKKLTSNYYDIWRNELGDFPTHKNIESPVRSGDVNESFRIKQTKSGNWRGVDYGGDCWQGNGIEFVMRYYNLTFGQAIQKIVNDLGLKKSDVEYKKVIKQEEQRIVKPQSEILYEFDGMPFTKAHHKYFNAGGLSEDFVTKEGDIEAIGIWAIEKKVQKFTKDEIAFGYRYRDEDGKYTGQVKILRIGPEIDKKFKWRTNVPNPKLWYLYKYKGKQINQLFVAKSNKDALCTIKQGIPSVPTQSENDVILRDNIPLLLTYCPNLIMNFGNDPQSVNASKNITKEFNLRWFNVPKGVYEFGLQDNFDYIKEFGEKSFINLLKIKGYLK